MVLLKNFFAVNHAAVTTRSPFDSLETVSAEQQLMTDGWLKDPQKYWAVRFHREPQSGHKDVRVLVDHGRKLSQGNLRC